MALRSKAARRWMPLLAALTALVIPAGFVPAHASTSRAATTDTSPVNLSDKIDMAAGKAARPAVVQAGGARFEVLAPDVIRLEYSATGTFLDQPTLNVLDRRFQVPPYRTTTEDGWLTITTSAMTLRYRLGSGPFSTANTQLHLLGKSAAAAATATGSSSNSNVQPSWEWECTFGQVCQSGAAALAGGAGLATNHNGYVSPAGFIAGFFNPGDAATWQVLGAPAGAATVTVRYANSVGGLGGPAPRTMTLLVNGTATQLTLPPTASWDDWSSVTAPVNLQSGTNSVAVECATGDECNVNVDAVAVTAPGATASPVLPAGQLGGYIRSLDSADGTYATGSLQCPNGESGDTCQAGIPTEAQGLLDKSGWYLLDDTRTAVWTSDGWISPRPADDTQDGYLFGYGENYNSALEELAKLTGPAPLLPEYAFGNWYSRFYSYTADEYENQVLPQFTANGVSLDTLSIDTGWKSPNGWDGWEWNNSLFPDPSAFLAWAKSQGVHVTMNIHSSIATDDPEYNEAQAIAGNTLACSSGECTWDWSNVAQAESNFALQQPIQDQGVPFWWLDWCCDNSDVSMPGVTPDSWINHLYAQQLINTVQRGFVLSRIGASLQNSVAGSYPSGAWTDHRSAIAFTGDAWSTWNTLAMEAQLSQDEASIGEPYISDDIGGFLGAPPGGFPNDPSDPSDLYLRWLQLGTFQPIMREHSQAGQNARLPWEYDASTQATGDAFLQLREELVPYLYTLAAQASNTGLPMTQPLYLQYPDQDAAYQHPTEYLLGSNMLVAPVTSPGTIASTTVWFPPGRWTDWFTGATVTGPSTQTLQVPLNRMPVFVKDGGIIPLQSSTGHAQTAGSAPITLRVAAGGDSQYSMYDDAGTGLGYTHGQQTDTPISYTTRGDESTLAISPARGTYPGAPTARSYTVNLSDLSAPRSVLIDGRPLPPAAWSYNSATDTLQVPVGDIPVHAGATITQIGGAALQLAEPAATELAINPPGALTVAAGATTTVSATLANSGPGTISNADLHLTAPTGWSITPTTSTTAASVAAGSALTASWSVTAPAGAAQTETAILSTSASYTDDATGKPETETTSQTPTPSITAITPATASAGQVATITGTDFGTGQGDSYVTFTDDGTNWGAPQDAAAFTIDSWSDDKITFTIPPSSGQWHVDPGSTATATVTTTGGTSNAGSLTIGSG